jgi:hypothetical protein
MKLLALVASFAALGLGSLAAADSAGTPSYQIKLSHTGIVEIGDPVQIGVFNDFGKAINLQLLASPATLRNNLKLYLDGVAMDGLQPEILSANAFVRADPSQPSPTLVLQFSLERDANNELNRKAWDALLVHLVYGKQLVQVGVSLNNGIPQLTETKELEFQVRSRGVIVTVIVVGLALFVLLLWWAVKTPMLRNNGNGSAYSLGKSQMAFWGLLVALSFSGVWVIGHRMERIPPSVLILLGISGATGLSSILITNNKQATAVGNVDDLVLAKKKLVEEVASLGAEKTSLEADKIAGGVQWILDKEKRLAVVAQSLEASKQILADKDQAIIAQSTSTKPTASTGSWWTDIISDDTGLSFHRFQVVLWTVILGVIFVCSVATTVSMPEFDQTLLILMGISNGTYLGFKIPEKAG